MVECSPNFFFSILQNQICSLQVDIILLNYHFYEIFIADQDLSYSIVDFTALLKVIFFFFFHIPLSPLHNWLGYFKDIINFGKTLHHFVPNFLPKQFLLFIHLNVEWLKRVNKSEESFQSVFT